MRQFFALFKKEFLSYFSSYTAYFIIILYMLLSMLSCFYLGGYFLTDDTALYSFFYFQPHVMLLIIPALVMRSWSEEKKSGTFEILLSYPVSYRSLILSKFLASFSISLVMIFLTLPLWFYTAFNANIDNMNIFSAYIGVVFISAMFCSFSCFISATNSSSVVSYLLSVFLLWILVSIDYNFILAPLEYASNLIFVNTQGALNFEAHYNSFVSGQIGLDDFIYFILFVSFALFINKIVVEDRKERSWVNISIFASLLFVMLMLLNVISAMLFSTSKFDFTSDRRYTLSDATKDIISNLSEPIDVKIYLSKDLKKKSPKLGDYSQFVLNYLDKYKKTSKGKIIVDVKTVERFSLTEREAKENGIISFIDNNDGELIYFGAIVSNIHGKNHTINTFLPSRKQYLERDITRAIFNISRTVRNKTVGVVNAIETTNYDDVLAKLLSKDYNVVKIDSDEIEIPLSVDILLVNNVQNSSTFLSYAIDQFLLSGRKAITFADNINVQSKGKEKSMYIPNILYAWGVKYSNEWVVTDSLQSVKMKIDDATVGKKVVNDILSMNITKDYINQKNPITYGLTRMDFETPSLLNIVDMTGVNVVSLVTTSNNSKKVKKDVAVFRDDTHLITKSLVGDDNQHDLILLSEGTTISTFTSGLLDGTPYEKDVLPFLPISIAPSKLVTIADSDFINGSGWSYYGDAPVIYNTVFENNNFDFILRTVDYLADNNELLDIGNNKVIYNSNSILDKIRNNVKSKYIDEIEKTTLDIVNKEKEINKFSESIDAQFSMVKVKELDSLKKEFRDLKERSNYLDYMVSRETDKIVYNLVVYISFIFPMFASIIMFLIVSMFRMRRRKKVLEVLSES